MTTYTLTEARAKIAEVFPGVATITDDQVRTFADSFGLTLEEPKTEPGIYLHDDGRVFDLAAPDATLVWYMPTDSPWVAANRDRLTPARVVTEAEWEDRGHGAALPSRGQVREALAVSWVDWTAVGRPESITAHTDAVMALFTEGGKA